MCTPPFHDQSTHSDHATWTGTKCTPSRSSQAVDEPSCNALLFLLRVGLATLGSSFPKCMPAVCKWHAAHQLRREAQMPACSTRVHWSSSIAPHTFTHVIYIETPPAEQTGRHRCPTHTHIHTSPGLALSAALFIPCSSSLCIRPYNLCCCCCKGSVRHAHICLHLHSTNSSCPSVCDHVCMLHQPCW
jgi:hypothetical protein